MAKYIVNAGDTLYKIAAKLSGTKGRVVESYVSALVSLNNIVDANKIYPGQVINYPKSWEGSGRQGVTIDVPMDPNPRSRYRSKINPVFKSNRPGALVKQSRMMSIIKNPMIMGAIAIGVMVYLTSKK